MKLQFTLLYLLLAQVLVAQIKSTNSFFSNSDCDIKELRISLPKTSSLGNYYYTDNWNAGNIYLTNGEVIRGYYLRYEIVRNQVELIVDRDIRVLNGDRVKHFEWYDPKQFRVLQFSNSSDFKFTEGIPSSFLEILVDGEAKLLKRTLIKSLRGTTSPTLVANTKASTIEQFELFYIVIAGTAHEIAGNKQTKLELFGDKYEQIKEFVKTNNIRLNNQEQFIEVTKFYNSL